MRHEAAPSVIRFQLLLCIHPQAVQQPESNLHFAVNLQQLWGLSDPNEQQQQQQVVDQQNPVLILETLLSAKNPYAVITKEWHQGRTPFHFAAATTKPSNSTPIARHSPATGIGTHLLLECPTIDLLWESDLPADAAHDIALQEMTCGSVEMDWMPNPLLELAAQALAPPKQQREFMKKPLQQPQPEDTSFNTDATSVTICMTSSGSDEEEEPAHVKESPNGKQR